MDHNTVPPETGWQLRQRIRRGEFTRPHRHDDGGGDGNFAHAGGEGWHFLTVSLRENSFAKLGRRRGAAKAWRSFIEPVEGLFAGPDEALLLPEPVNLAALQHLDPDRQAGMAGGDGRKDGSTQAAALRVGFKVEGMDFDMIGCGRRGDAADEAPFAFDGRKRRRIESGAHSCAAPIRVESADPIEIRPQHADGQVEERFEIRFPDRTQGEGRAHAIPAQNFWMRPQASFSAASEVA